MQPPKDPVARIAWEYHFFRSKRVKTRDEAEALEYDDATYYFDRGYGRRVHQPIVLKDEHYMFIYGVHMNGQVWTPYKWWASADADPLDIQFAFWSCHDRWPEPLQNWLDAVNANSAEQPHDGGKWAGSPEVRIVAARLALLGLRQRKAYPYQEYLAQVSPALRRKFMRHIIDLELEELGTCHNGYEGDTRDPLGLYRKADGKGFIVYNRKWCGDGAFKEVAMETGDLDVSPIPVDYDRDQVARNALRKRILKNFRKGYAKICSWKWSQDNIPSEDDCWNAMAEAISGGWSGQQWATTAFGFTATQLSTQEREVFQELMALR
jgi:hypothetical protein